MMGMPQQQLREKGKRSTKQCMNFEVPADGVGARLEWWWTGKQARTSPHCTCHAACAHMPTAAGRWHAVVHCGMVPRADTQQLAGAPSTGSTIQVGASVNSSVKPCSMACAKGGWNAVGSMQHLAANAYRSARR